MAYVRITDLLIRTIIGTHDWERTNKQDILINVTFAYDCEKASKSDNIKNAVDYKTITKRIVKDVEASEFYLLEKLVQFVLDILMEEKRIKEATVRIDKPHALRFARSVSLELTAKR